MKVPLAATTALPGRLGETAQGAPKTGLIITTFRSDHHQSGSQKITRENFKNQENPLEIGKWVCHALIRLAPQTRSSGTRCATASKESAWEVFVNPIPATSMPEPASEIQASGSSRLPTASPHPPVLEMAEITAAIRDRRSEPQPYRHSVPLGHDHREHAHDGTSYRDSQPTQRP